MSAGARPERVAVVGAGMVGLATAWFLQERGVETVVFDRDGVASGASHGNAGWLTPSFALPLPEPGVLRYAVRTLFDPASPVYVPPTANPTLVRFLLQFARNCTRARFDRALTALAGLNRGALAAFAELDDPDLEVVTRPAAPLIAAYLHEHDREALLEEFAHAQGAGLDVPHQLLSGEQVRDAVPLLSDRVVAGLRVDGGRFLDPAVFVRGLAEAVKQRGGLIRTGTPVDEVAPTSGDVRVAGERFDAVVLATGAQLGRHARKFGVRQLVQAGRGYSFTVAADNVPPSPVYFPAQRVALSPSGGRLKLAGMMEFRAADAPLDPRRVTAIADAAAPLVRGADLTDRRDEWVGARPCTADGLPLVGRSRHERVFVAGGHGMWGMTLGPVTGKLLAEQVVTGRTPDALRPVDPLR
ncbi:NAD(P)/FAD-dependent oxidoreductase [Jatrophihabitans sp. YIM 134969]